MTAQSSRVWKKIFAFYALTLLFSAIFYAAILSAGMQAGGGSYVIALMWCPGVAALAVKALFHERVRDLGWEWGQTRFAIWGYLIPVLYSLCLYTLVWLTGLGDVPNAEFIAGATGSFGWRGNSTALFLAEYIALATTAGMVTNVAACLGEEIGWRGFLVPELAKVVGFKGVAIISGLMWAGWHAPVLVFGEYNSGTPAWFGMTCFTVMAVSGSFILARLTLRSGSIWPAVVFHTSHNVFVQMVFTPLTADTGITKYVIGEFGAGLAIASVVAAVIVCRKVAVQAPGGGRPLEERK